MRRVERVNKLTKNGHLPSLGLSFEPGWYQHEVAITTWSLFSIHMIYLSGGSRGGTWGALVPPIFKPKGGPKGQKTFFGDRPPPPPIIWRSGSATDTVFCLSVTCAMFNRTMFLRFRQVFCLCFLTSCCSRRRNDSSQLVTPAYLMISELAWSRAVKNRAQS